MTKLWTLITVLAIAVPSLVAQTDSSPATQFEVASIKRHVGGYAVGRPPFLPSGEVRLVNWPMRSLILFAYPVDVTPAEIIGLPSWATSDDYDVIAKGKAGASSTERQQMFRSLFSDRMKLRAHYDTRERATYDLVLARADRSLGPGLTRSTLDCTQTTFAGPPPPGSDRKTFAMGRCNSIVMNADGTLYAGGVRIPALFSMFKAAVDRPIVDKTGLAGYYAVTIRYQRVLPRPGVAPSPDDPPSLFTALQEQLGLKLEPSKTQAQVLVIDHIERPDPD